MEKWKEDILNLGHLNSELNQIAESDRNLRICTPRRLLRILWRAYLTNEKLLRRSNIERHYKTAYRIFESKRDIDIWLSTKKGKRANQDNIKQRLVDCSYLADHTFTPAFTCVQKLRGLKTILDWTWVISKTKWSTLNSSRILFL